MSAPFIFREPNESQVCSCFFSDALPWHKVRVMLQNRQDNLITGLRNFHL